jgi:uncharacterized lipoprotein YajG
MSKRLLFLLVGFLSILFLAGCNAAPTTSTTPASRSYHGTASVGDFLSITIDATAQTITYTDVSNGDSGSVP